MGMKTFYIRCSIRGQQLDAMTSLLSPYEPVSKLLVSPLITPIVIDCPQSLLTKSDKSEGCSIIPIPIYPQYNPNINPIIPIVSIIPI